MPTIHQKKRSSGRGSKGRTNARNKNRRQLRSKLTVKQKVKNLLTRLDQFPQDHFNKRDLVSLDVITEISNNGIVKIEHLRILERVLNNVSVAQKEKKSA